MKKSGKRGMIIASAVLVAGLAAGGTFFYVHAATKVSSGVVQKGSLSQEIELNGRVASGTEKKVFAGANVKVAQVLVKEGDSVKKGDLLVSFEEDDIDYQIAMAEYEARINAGEYQNAYEQGRRASALYNEATINIGVLNGQIEETEATLQELQKKLLERRAAFAGEGAALQKSIIDSTYEEDNDALQNLQKLAQSNAYNQQYDDEMIKLQEEINRQTVILQGYKEYKAEMVSQKAASYGGVLTAGQKEVLEAKKEADGVQKDKLVADYESAKEGIRAEFDGIITSINVTEGAEIGKGAEIITLASSKDIFVQCNANKYDIMSVAEGQKASVRLMNRDYTGTVTRIDRVTDQGGTQNPGVGVEVKLDNPDNDLILGMETKARISTAELDEVLRIPSEALNSDDDGSYVFVMQDKKAVKKTVEAGAKSDSLAEIKSGLNEGEIVVWSDSTELKNGMEIKQ